MAKSKPKKAKKGKSGGFIAKLFDIFTALIIMAVIAAAVWYWFFYSEKKGNKITDNIKDLYESSGEKITDKTGKTKKKTSESVIDEKADEDEMEKIDSDIIGDEDEMMDQFEDEIVSNYNPSEDSKPASGQDGFFRSVNKWASKYEGLKVRSNADPDEDNATDNSHLICSIWEHAAKENNRKFKGYIPTDKILDDLDRIGKDEFRNGDLMVLKDGMFGMVINYKDPLDYEIIYASGEKNKVVVIDIKTMKNYWLKPENFKGYYRAEKEILN